MTAEPATTAPASTAEPRRIVPSWLRRTLGDPLAKRLARLLPSERFGVLWTTRRDGTWRTTALGIWPQDGRRHLVALFGETYWVADLRAGRPARLQSGGDVSDVALRELDAHEATDFWMAFARKFSAPAGRYTGISAEPSREEAAAIAAGHAVFVVEEDRASDQAKRSGSWRRTLGIGLVLGVVAALVNAALVTVLVALTGVDPDFRAVGVVPVMLFTVGGLLGAAIGFGLVQRRAARPRRTWGSVATIALALSWLPDLLLLVSPETPMGTAGIGHVAVLMVLHLPAYAVAVTLLPSFLGGPDPD